MTATTTRTPRPRRAGPRLAAALALALGLAACGSGDDGAEDDAAATSTAAEDTAGDGATTDEEATEEAATDEPTADEATDAGGDTGEAAPVATAETDLGTILVTGDGFTLYGFTNDEQGGPSACTEGCLETWPPLLVDGAEVPGGLDDEVFGVLERADGGGFQLMADGWPLYTYAPDQEPGDTTGQGVGDVWWVVQPDGTLVQDAG